MKLGLILFIVFSFSCEKKYEITNPTLKNHLESYTSDSSDRYDVVKSIMFFKKLAIIKNDNSIKFDMDTVYFTVNSHNSNPLSPDNEKLISWIMKNKITDEEAMLAESKIDTNYIRINLNKKKPHDSKININDLVEEVNKKKTNTPIK